MNPRIMRHTFCPTESLTSRPIHSARKYALCRLYTHGFPYSRQVSQPRGPTPNLTKHQETLSAQIMRQLPRFLEARRQMAR